MTDGYDCYQNALAERVNGILKNKFLFMLPDSLIQARRLVDRPSTATTRNGRICP